MFQVQATTTSLRSTRRGALRRLGAALTALGCGVPAYAATPRLLRIGTTYDSSGVEKVNGAALQLGAMACFNAVNKAGGIGGAHVELVTADDQFKPELAKVNALAFGAERSIVALLHPVGTRQTAAVIEAVQDMAIVGPNTGTAALRKKVSANVFWLRASYDQEIDKLIATAATLGVRNIGLVHPNDPLGQSLLAAFTVATDKYQLPRGVIATTPNTTSPEVEPAAAAIAKAAPQVVIMGLAGTAPAFVRALRAAGGSSTVYGLSIGASAANLRAFGDAARGLGFSSVGPSPHAATYEIVRRYQADMEASGSSDYSLPSLEGYINARVLCEGLRRAGSLPTRAQLISALDSIEALDLGGLRIGFGKGRREGNNFVDVAVIGSSGRLIS